jgi:hypothetical protein
MCRNRSMNSSTKTVDNRRVALFELRMLPPVLKTEFECKRSERGRKN